MAYLHDVADAAADTLDEIDSWDMTGDREGQYGPDVVVDDVIVDMLEAAGFVVLSEESTPSRVEWPFADDRLLVVVDPLDGSTNASKGFPWFATSLCVVDRDGPRVALVSEQSGTETRFGAVRGGGANLDGQRIRSRPVEDIATAVIGSNGIPPVAPTWWQTRVLGAAALDISLVASGGIDGYIDFHDHGVWDYLAAVLICREAGCVVGDAFGRDLMVVDPGERRTPIVANSRPIFDALVAMRRG
jgi:fructose-1,6-bisphosphatase/inositol monophosphatase family enzyme